MSHKQSQSQSKSLEEHQTDRHNKISSITDDKNLHESIIAIDKDVEEVIFKQKLEYLNMKTGKNRKSSQTNDSKEDEIQTIDNNLLGLELSEDQLKEFQAEFDQILQELKSLLAEIGALISELGSPPDMQKLSLLKDKLNKLKHVRSRVRRFGFKIPFKYHKDFGFDKYYSEIQNFVSKNEGNLRKLAKDSKHNKNSDYLVALELSLQRDKIFENLSEKLARLENKLESENDIQKTQVLQKEIALVKEEILLLENQMNLKTETAANQQNLLVNASAVEHEMLMESAAAAMFAELNGLIQGQTFGHANFLEANSINMHSTIQTMDEVLNDFYVTAVPLENSDKLGITHAEHKKHPQANLVEAESLNQSREVISRNDALLSTSKNPQLNIENIEEHDNSLSSGSDSPSPLPSSFY